MIEKDVNEITYMSQITIFSVATEKNNFKGEGVLQLPLVRQGLTWDMKRCELSPLRHVPHSPSQNMR